ncbi:MAG: hypothetical protein LBN37_04910 [Bacteroidales bacterium]|jgi:hypothetical protein|nr:hypothetical protein [Bacteroidales bacterium]
MIRFEKDRLIIEIKHYCPVEYWQELQQGLYDLIRHVNQDTISNTFHEVISLLEELIPETDDAKKMAAK